MLDKKQRVICTGSCADQIWIFVVGGNCATDIMTAQLKFLSDRRAAPLDLKHFTSITK